MRKITTKRQDEKFTHDLYFNTKKRNVFKRSFLGLQKEIIENTPTDKPLLKEDYDNREFAVDFLRISIIALKRIKEAEEFRNCHTLKRCKFKLYRSSKKLFVIENSFYRLSDKTFNAKFIFFPNGYPLGDFKVKAKMTKEMSLEGYEMVDQGIFKQKVENFDKFSVSYRGNFFKEKFLFKQMKGSNENLWTRKISIRKRRV